MLRDLLAAGSTAALDSDGHRLLLRTDSTRSPDGTARTGDTDQLAEWEDGRVRPLTTGPDRVVTARYRPRHRQAVVEGDVGGDERSGLWLLDLAGDGPVDRAAMRPLTADPGAVHHLAGVSRDGRRVAVLSNRRDGVAFDLWVTDLDGGGERLLAAPGGWCRPASGFSPDDRWVSVLRPGPGASDDELLLVDVATGEVRELLAHPGDPSVVGPPAWVDARTLVVSTDVGRDRQALVRVDLDSGRSAVVVQRPWDVAGWTSPDGSLLLAVSNAAGTSHAELFDSRTLAPKGVLPLPDPDAVIAVSHLLPDPVDGPSGTP